MKANKFAIIALALSLAWPSAGALAQAAMANGEVKKIDYARILAACLSYFAYQQRDGVGLLTFDTEIRSHVPASRRRGQLMTILFQPANPAIPRSRRASFRSRWARWTKR